MSRYATIIRTIEMRKKGYIHSERKISCYGSRIGEKMTKPLDLSNMDEVDAILYLQSFMKSGLSFNFSPLGEELGKLIIMKSIAVITTVIDDNISLSQRTNIPEEVFITDGDRLKRYLDYPGSIYEANVDKLILCS